jgi:large subunit ribosomal protein L35
MSYKFKPNKGAKKRFRVTKTGKVKHRHELSTHLRSGRTAKKKRHLGRPAILFEGHARNMRKLMGVSGRRPNQIAHERALAGNGAAEEKAAS